MEIRLQHIIPLPIASRDFSLSDIWGKDVIFLPKKKIHIYAPSGTGKSSLIHILYGLRKDYTGNLFLQNTNYKNLNYTLFPAIRKLHLSVVFQDLRLFKNLTGIQNLKTVASLTNEVNESSMQEMANDLGITHLLNRTCNTMSLGEQQRLSIVRALCRPFKWLLLDEPFSHLDEKNIEKAKLLIEKECLKNNAGFIIASLGNHYEMQFDINLKL